MKYGSPKYRRGLKSYVGSVCNVIYPLWYLGNLIPISFGLYYFQIKEKTFICGISSYCKWSEPSAVAMESRDYNLKVGNNLANKSSLRCLLITITTQMNKIVNCCYHRVCRQ